MRWLALALACAACPSQPATDFFGTHFGAWVPHDVREFVVDAQACAHFSGEEPYDAERRIFLESRIRKSCNGLDERKHLLDRRYRRSEGIRAMISKALGSAAAE